MSAQQAEPSGAAMTVVFDTTSNFAHVPNLLGYHPGARQLVGWITTAVAPVAIRKRLKPGWHVHLDPGLKGELRDRQGAALIAFSVVPGHRL
ncbi:hypothetical protein SEA_HIRKO_64 [Arthrobacter phage Hirko]|nr:hypothetical protein SEA_HIRKO_64 [Arthrobacter phage Hirko]